MSSAPQKAPKAVSAEAIAEQIAQYSTLPLKDLKAAWAGEFRREPPKGLWQDVLLRTLAWRLQERAFGGHDKAAVRLLEAYGQNRAGDPRCHRLKAGSVLVREYGGARHTVTIVAGGFAWQDKTYLSLSAIARIITGTNWNGPRFFGLREVGGKKNGKSRRSSA